LNANPYIANLISKKVWPGSGYQSLESDCNFIYAGGRGVYKIDPRTMLDVGYADIAGDALTFDGTYIYATVEYLGYVYKIDSRDMTVIDPPHWEDPIGGYVCSIIYANGFIYVGVEEIGNYVMIYKIDTTTMATVGWQVILNAYEPHGLTYDGLYLYAGISLTVANSSRIYKINPDTMAIVGAQWILNGDPSATIQSLITDGTYIYAGLMIVTGGYPYVYKINPVSMTTVLTWTALATQNYAHSLLYDGKYIYVGIESGIMYGVTKLNKDLMTTISHWRDLSGASLYALTFDGLFIYAGFTYYGVTRKIMKDIDESE
jgi:hypothetical protein